RQKLAEERQRRDQEAEETRLNEEAKANERRIQEDLERQRWTDEVRKSEAQQWPDKQKRLENLRTDLSGKKCSVIDLARSGTLTYEQLDLVVDNHRLYG